MDYLVYVEHNAENLQFYLWFKEYERRFANLSENEKALSPEWDPNMNEVPNLATDPEKEAAKAKRQTANGVEPSSESRKVVMFAEERELAASEDRHATMFNDGSTIAASDSEITTTPSMAEATAQAGLKWQPCEFPY
jgi:hypothetical protein